MGLFSSIFGKTIQIDHEFFGKMLFRGSKRPEPTDYFECRRPFKPSGDIIEIGIDGDVSGPTERQVQFFKSIEDNYSQVTKAVTPLIEDEFKNFKEDFKIIDFHTEFVPVYLRIPRCESEPVIWEIAFESDHDRNHTFTLTMHDFEAKEILIDG
jgi:hypothetical protein